MADSIKLVKMQRTSMEFERQRHLANWFIKSSPHMANSQSLNPNGNNTNNTNNNNGNNSTSNSNKAQKLSNSTRNGGGITTANSLFLLMPSGQKPSQLQNHQLSSNLALFTSQTNIPLQESHHKSKLRRFNSHDTSSNMFSVAEFENARLQRRNEIELKQRKQQQRLKINSTSSGGDCSTNDSKGSKYSNESQSEPLSADAFLERYPLPRVVRISYKSKFTHETLQSSSSNGSSSTNSSLSFVNKTNCDQSKQNGELFLLYRHLPQRKMYHGHNTKSGVGSRKKGVIIPQEYPGYFSFVNEKGCSTATMYTTLIQLVRERVYKFISVDNLPAFTESQNTTDTFQARTHYIKSTARGGQVFRLLAVFEDGKPDNGLTNNKNSNSGREKEKGRYAQLLNENRQILYVSLTTKGKFYEIEASIPQILQKTAINNDIKRKNNPDCVHRINNIITSIDNELPINLKFISGPSTVTTSNSIPENITITKITTENILIGCQIDNIETQLPLNLKKLHITTEMIFVKCFLGFENEQRMLANQNVQNILKFCQFNCDHFLKMIELERLINNNNNKSRTESLKILKPLNFPKLLRREKSVIAHERENSIIFLSKNDLANLGSSSSSSNNNNNNNNNEQNSIQQASSSSLSPTTATNQNRISDKMKVFQSTKKKWFKRNSLTNLNSIDEQAKRLSMERYNDMSKLMQERFGNNAVSMNHNIDEQKSDIDCIRSVSSSTTATTTTTTAIKKTNKIQKSLSLQDVDFLIDKPDIVPINFNDMSINGSENNLNYIEKDKNNKYEEISSNSKSLQHNQQSFISEKMYSEFHVKTRQYSKSSSSLHQLLNFTVIQQRKNDDKKDKNDKRFPKNLEFSFSDISLKELNTISNPTSPISITASSSSYTAGPSFTTTRTAAVATTTTFIDDLPYSSVRDSLVNAESSNFSDDNFGDANNIYAEIPANNNEEGSIVEIDTEDESIRGAI